MLTRSRVFFRSTVAATLSALLLAQAQSASSPGAPVLKLTSDRADGIYAKGGTAWVEAAAQFQAAPAGGWAGAVKIKRNPAQPAEGLAWEDPSKPLWIPVSERGPGRVTVEVFLWRTDGQGNVISTKTGLLFRPGEIALATPEPPDFRAFWQRQLAQWKKLAWTVELHPADSPVPGVKCWDLAILTDDQTPVRGYLAAPDGATAKSLPALLSLHGAGFRSARLEGAARQAARGFLALDINAHGLPNGQPPVFYQNAEKELADYRVRGIESPETWYFKSMFLRVARATEYLAGRPEWNGRDLVLVGSSQGGAQALAGAALDDRVTAIAASVPAFCDLLAQEVGRPPGWPKPVPLKKGDDPGNRERIKQTAAYFDAGNFARLIHVPVLISMGLIDETCPADGVQAMANALHGQTTLLYRPSMGHAFPADVAKEFDRFLIDSTRHPVR